MSDDAGLGLPMLCPSCVPFGFGLTVAFGPGSFRPAGAFGGGVAGGDPFADGARVPAGPLTGDPLGVWRHRL